MYADVTVPRFYVDDQAIYTSMPILAQWQHPLWPRGDDPHYVVDCRQECLKLLPESDMDQAFENCVFDTCTLDEITEQYACAAAVELTSKCSTDYGLEFDWRTDDFCSLYSYFD